MSGMTEPSGVMREMRSWESKAGDEAHSEGGDLTRQLSHLREHPRQCYDSSPAVL